MTVSAQKESLQKKLQHIGFHEKYFIHPIFKGSNVFVLGTNAELGGVGIVRYSKFMTYKEFNTFLDGWALGKAMNYTPAKNI